MRAATWVAPALTTGSEIPVFPSGLVIGFRAWAAGAAALTCSANRNPGLFNS